MRGQDYCVNGCRTAVFSMFLAILVSCTAINERVRQTTLSPAVEPQLMGPTINQALTLILGNALKDEAEAPKVCKIRNFRSSLEKVLIETLAPQFAAVSTSPIGPQGHGLELLVLEAQIPESHQALQPGGGPATMTFEIHLNYNGVKVDEYRATTPAPPPSTSNQFNWRCSLLTEYYERNIESFAEQVQTRLTKDKNLIKFWQSLDDQN